MIQKINLDFLLSVCSLHETMLYERTLDCPNSHTKGIIYHLYPIRVAQFLSYLPKYAIFTTYKITTK